MEHSDIINYIHSTRKGITVGKKFKIDKSIPKIYLPKEKLNMFLDWYDQDLKFQVEIPQALNEGYIFIENEFIKFNEEPIKESIKKQAKILHTTYNMIKKAIEMLEEETKHAVIYFKFLNNSVNVFCFIDERQVAYLNCNFDLDQLPKFETVRNIPIKSADFDHEGVLYAYNLLCIFVAVMWYLATTKNVNKYRYEVDRYATKDNDIKKVVQIKDKRVVTTPIYDMGKIKTIKVDKLIQHRKGWTYSHSFGVCGHYRHYKSGKVIFVKPFIKGKGKDKKVQDIILNPGGDQ